MDIPWSLIIYVIFLIDSMGAIVMSWFGQMWWPSYKGPLNKWFPAAKGWSVLYFVLILVIGYLLGFIPT